MTTKDDLIRTKELVELVLNEKKNNNKANITMREYSFNERIYPTITSFSLSTIAFNDSDIMKSIAILTGILTYEELRYILTNLKSILLTNKKLKLLQKSKYEQLLSLLSTDEIKEINYLETKRSK